MYHGNTIDLLLCLIIKLFLIQQCMLSRETINYRNYNYLGQLNFRNNLSQTRFTLHCQKHNKTTACLRGSITFLRCSLLVTRCRTTPYSLQNLLVNHCTSCSLQKITCYSLQKFLIVKTYSLLVPEVTCCKKSLVNSCKICSLLVA